MFSILLLYFFLFVDDDIVRYDLDYEFLFAIVTAVFYCTATLLDIRDFDKLCAVNRIIKKINSYSLFVYFGYLIREGAFQLRGLELDLITFIIPLCFEIYFYKPVSIPSNKSGQKRQKMRIGSEMSEKTIGEKFWHTNTMIKQSVKKFRKVPRSFAK
jgi:hypothetical protein